MWNRRIEPALALGCASVAVVLAGIGVSVATARPIDPTLPHRIVAGPPGGPAPMDRIDPGRTGRTTTKLPKKPRVAWRARVPGGVEHPPVVDAAGRIFTAASVPQVSQVDKTGKLEWSARTGSSATAVPPAVASDASKWIVTAAGEVFAFDPRGAERFRTPLPARAPTAALLPREDGGMVVAVQKHIQWLEQSGAVRSRASLETPAIALIGRGADVVVVSDTGVVYLWSPPAEPTRRGDFGGRVTGGPLLSGSELLANVDDRRIVALDLATGTHHTRVAEGPFTLEGAPAVDRNGHTRSLTADGLLLGHDKSGKEAMRVALEPLLGSADAGIARLGGASRGAAAVVDPDGTVGFAQPGLDAGIVTAAGEVRTAKGAACAEPVAVVPAGPKRLLVACRSGLLWMLTD